MTKTDKWTIAKIRQSNHTNGQHYFLPAVQKVFSSQVNKQVYQGKAGVYFVTSERGDKYSDESRRYSVRQFIPETGCIETIGEFRAHTRASAHRAAAQLAEVGE